MKFLADESIDFPIIQLLRHYGFDIKSVSEEFPSKDDEFVLETANAEGRLLIIISQTPYHSRTRAPR